MSTGVFDSVEELLTICDSAMNALEDRCCSPARSPRMAELRLALESTRSLVTAYSAEAVRPGEVVRSIETAGAQVGGLQVSCCAPDRMPLYDTIQHNLMEVQRRVKRHAKLAH